MCETHLGGDGLLGGGGGQAPVVTPRARRASARDPGPGVMTMRRTLKRDLAPLLTQRRKKENQWALYGVGTVESILSPKNPAPVPSVSILQHSQT